VALFMNNCPQYLLAHYAIQKIGAIVCPCGPLNKAHELQYQLQDLQARVIIAADNLLPIVEQVRGQTALAHVLAALCRPAAGARPPLPCRPSCRPRPAPAARGRGRHAQLAQQGAALASARGPWTSSWTTWP
jgi:long-chain acyl-CoA synthetase